MFDYVTWWRHLAATLLLSASCVHSAAAQEHLHTETATPTITLDEIVEQIENQNPVLLASRLHAEALGTVPAQVSAWPDPSVGVAYQLMPMLTAHGAQRTQWSVEQTIPYPGKLSLKEEIAELEAEAAALDSEAVLDDLILHAKEAYYELYRLGETERLLLQFQDEFAGYVEASAVRYEVGNGPQQALLKAQLEKNQISQRLHHIEGARRRAAETLARLTDHPDGTQYFLAAEPVLARADDLESAALTETAVEKRPEFAALEAAAQRAAREVRLARKEAYPDLSLHLTYFDIASREIPPTATGRDAVAIGVGLRLPLQRGRISARIEEARLRQAQIEAQQEALHTQVRTQVEELMAALEHEGLAIGEYEDVLLPQAETTVEATLNAYAAGTSGFLDLLDAERTAFGVRTGYVDAVTRYLTFAARLERVLGIRSLGDVYAGTSGSATISPPSSEIE